MFIDLHFFNIKDEDSIKYLESECRFATKNHDFFVRDLVSQTHISRNPFGFIAFVRRYFLPRVALDIINFDDINNSFLVHASTESKEILVFERAKCYSRSRSIEWSNEFPFIFLRIVSFTERINLIINKSANDINE